MPAGLPRVPPAGRYVVCPRESGFSEPYPEKFPGPTQQFSRLWWSAYQKEKSRPCSCGSSVIREFLYRMRGRSRSQDRASQTNSPRTRSRSTATPKKLGGAAGKVGRAVIAPMKAMRKVASAAGHSRGVMRRLGGAADNYAFGVICSMASWMCNAFCLVWGVCLPSGLLA